MKEAQNGQGTYAGAALAGLGSAAIVTMPMTVLDMAVIRSQLSKRGLRDGESVLPKTRTCYSRNAVFRIEK